MARPAHAAEVPPGKAYGLSKNQPNGKAVGRPVPAPVQPTDTVAPGIVILDPVPTTIGSTEGSTATFRFNIADDSGQVAAAWLELSNDATVPVGLTDAGWWEGNVYNDGTLSGSLTWRVLAKDAAGNVSTVNGPSPLQVQATDTTAPAIAIVSVDPTEVSASGQTIAWITVDANDNSGKLDRLYVYAPSGLASTSNLYLQDDGHYRGYVQVNESTPRGSLAWQVIGTDAAGNTSTVDGQPLNVIA